MHMTETLIATTARSIMFTDGKGNMRRYPAGTEVYAHARRDGLLDIRVPRTLWTQTATYTSVVVP